MKRSQFKWEMIEFKNNDLRKQTKNNFRKNMIDEDLDRDLNNFLTLYLPEISELFYKKIEENNLESLEGLFETKKSLEDFHDYLSIIFRGFQGRLSSEFDFLYNKHKISQYNQNDEDKT